MVTSLFCSTQCRNRKEFDCKISILQNYLAGSIESSANTKPDDDTNCI